jgi:hypothetical protein
MIEPQWRLATTRGGPMFVQFEPGAGGYHARTRFDVAEVLGRGGADPGGPQAADQGPTDAVQ